MQLNQAAEAEALYATARDEFVRADDPGGAAAARHGLALLRLSGGNTAQATALLDGYMVL
jgi:hypothetical protein